MNKILEKEEIKAGRREERGKGEGGKERKGEKEKGKRRKEEGGEQGERRKTDLQCWK